MHSGTCLEFEDLLAIVQMGGVEKVDQVTRKILRQNQFDRGLFADHEIARILRSEKLLLHGLCFCYDDKKSVSANLADIFEQAAEIQKNSGGANFVGAMLQHLVGAKLDIVLGVGTASHHGFSVADHSTDRQGEMPALFGPEDDLVSESDF